MAGTIKSAWEVGSLKSHGKEHHVERPIGYFVGVAAGDSGRKMVRTIRSTWLGIRIAIGSFVLGFGLWATGNVGASAQSAGPSATATVWQVDRANYPVPSASSFTAMVARFSCNSGESGEIKAPTVAFESGRVVVTFSVVRPPSGEVVTCPPNDQVPFLVELGEPIGARQLADGSCLGGGAAVGTTFCASGAVRWPDPAADPAGDLMARTPSFVG